MQLLLANAAPRQIRERLRCMGALSSCLRPSAAFAGASLAGLAGQLLRHGLWAYFSPKKRRHCDKFDEFP